MKAMQRPLCKARKDRSTYEDRMLTITGGLENAIGIKRHYDKKFEAPSDRECYIEATEY